MILHPDTHMQLSQLKEHLPHALIVSGPEGMGKIETVLAMIKELHPEAKDTIAHANWQYLQKIEPEDGKKSIGIAQIKQLEELLRLKDAHKRYVLIDQAHAMTTEAQNSFLKTLEEPPEDTHIFLVTQSIEQLLPTIRSRAQHIHFKPIDEATFTNYLGNEYDLDQDLARRLFYITQGRPLAAARLAEDTTALDELLELTNDAKKFLQSDLGARLTVFEKYSKNTQLASDLLRSIIVVARAALSTSQTNNQKKHLASVLAKLFTAERRLKNYVQPKLVFAELMLKL